jgi:hypothetical protein
MSDAERPGMKNLSANESFSKEPVIIYPFLYHEEL